MPRHLAPAILALLALFTLAISTQAQAQDEGMTCYFFVVPASHADGSDTSAEIAALKVALARMAGGYTELGMSNGGSLGAGGRINTQHNFSFLVASKTDIGMELKGYLADHFNEDDPFILSWPADRVQ